MECMNGTDIEGSSSDVKESVVSNVAQTQEREKREYQHNTKENKRSSRNKSHRTHALNLEHFSRFLSLNAQYLFRGKNSVSELSRSDRELETGKYSGRPSSVPCIP